MADETKVVIQQDVLDAMQQQKQEKEAKKDLPASTKTLGLMMHIALYKQAKDPTLTQGEADKLIKERLESPMTRMDIWELKQRDPALLKEGMTVKEYYQIRDVWDKEHPERVKEINEYKKEVNEKNKGPLTDNLKRGLKDRGIPMTEGMTCLEGRKAIYKWAKENPEKEKELQEKYQMRKDAAGLDMTEQQIIGLKIRGIEAKEGMKRGEAAKAIHAFDAANPGVAQKAYEAYNAELQKRQEAEKAKETQKVAEETEKAKTQEKPKAKLVFKSENHTKSKTLEMSR